MRRDEIRLVEDTDGDGYADQATVFAEGFNSIQGLAYHGGTLFVMHAPFLTALADTDGDGKADERRDCSAASACRRRRTRRGCTAPTASTSGHDGWLYLALGDNGSTCRGRKGTGSCSTAAASCAAGPTAATCTSSPRGLRNIYDVALDDELNVFVRDNENDGGDYMIRVCHSFFGADHGYPYLYASGPTRRCRRSPTWAAARRPAASATARRSFPAEYRGDLFFCEWGRAVVRYRPQPRRQRLRAGQRERIRRRRAATTRTASSRPTSSSSPTAR